jgi:hypothetical protein
MYYEGWFQSVSDLVGNFGISEDALKGCKIHVAFYGDPQDWGYYGQAEVLFEKDKKLYSVQGSHCSCHGLEEQWVPQETDWKTVLHFLNNGGVYDAFSDKAKAYLKRVAVRRVKKAEASLKK